MKLATFKKVFRKVFGNTISVILKKVYSFFMYCLIFPLYQKILVQYIKRKKEINVVFIASTLPMWRYQNIYELLSKHPRFKVSIVILPFQSYSKDQQQNDVAILASYFDSIGIQYFTENEKYDIFDIRKKLHPDILFYPQPYTGLFIPQQDYHSFRDKLLCYYPYAFWSATGDWSYNLELHNCAWKLFYSTELHRKEAQKIAYNKGRNIEVVGYPNADIFLQKKHKYNWKPQTTSKKRLIWAPHFTIFPEGLMTQSNFLWMADFMLELTDKYFDKIQFVFKPHPRLLTELYEHDNWGKDKALQYYKEWSTRKNTQIEEGEFIDLFMTSDAMIHDCGSFSIEYHYSGNPVMFIAENFEQLVAEKGEFGKLAMRQHYVGKCKEDIINFIENVIIKEDDPMKLGRKDFYKQYLLPPNGKSVAENTMDVFLQTFC